MDIYICWCPCERTKISISLRINENCTIFGRKQSKWMVKFFAHAKFAVLHMLIIIIYHVYLINKTLYPNR
ncbi:hypothetical protein BpHYR1_040857 [Brachionus plicatilis]|uniref:Uncharacterized protein n=1 Tax=Brachionus plicatilis TaxID=10195 RepID=A0A3M7SLT1_BRAPC|nr:hypothetical protein BpHYR1_040857 [Brachionus plicatilis]